ncbi:MAG: bile acid:sodium symporter [Planctomycetaceae bacterium]|nr:bile acid:sodium symporter [Planctomycetaceae bacterium]
MKVKFDWFLTGMVVAVFLAWLLPTPGARGGWLHPELLTKGGVALIFFLHGVALSFSAMRAGALNIRLHLVVQACTYLLFPLIGWGIVKAGAGELDESLLLGFFYLCALPSTVSSSVAMTAAARGNVPAAVFNATLSSLLGVVLTPLWMRLVTGTGESSHSLGKVILDLVLWLVLPLAVGQISRPLLAGWAARNKRFIHFADRLTILMLVYTSFCDSMVEGIWTNSGTRALVATLLGTTALFYVVFLATGRICNALSFNAEDRIAAVFCGSKKSLATGVPMAQLMFGTNPGLGLILLPIMIYHPLQLFICGVLATRWSKRE